MGKAFEYACAYVIYEKYKSITDMVVENSPQMETAKNAFSSLTKEEADNYIKGAKAAIRIIDRFEPKLSQTTSSMTVCLQTDSQGIKGDVRDVLCIRSPKWEIGISCKHNHHALKHSRLSDQIDFGKSWFGRPCSNEYFEEVCKVFTPLRKMRDESKQTGIPVYWDVFKDKEEDYYVPVLNAFMKELKRLDEQYPGGEIPSSLIRYLIGTNDYYKVIMNDRNRFTQIEFVNINGTLNQSDGKKKALVGVPLLKLPGKFYEIGYKEGSRNTIIVVCDQGWNVSMRLHNAKKTVEPSLKFDVKLDAMPSSIMTQFEPWEE